jgi:hypothetical protein
VFIGLVLERNILSRSEYPSITAYQYRDLHRNFGRAQSSALKTKSAHIFLGHRSLVKTTKLLVFLLGLQSLFSGSLNAEDLKLYFAGFAFRGDYDQIINNFPRAYVISQELTADHRGTLDAALVTKIENINLINARIVIDELATLGDGSLTLAFCLDTELVSIEQHDDGYKLVIDLGAQALLFDYNQMKVVASFPIMVELIDYLPTEPDEAVIQSRINDMMLSDNYGVNLFDDFAALLERIEIKNSYGSSMMVSEVIIEEKASTELPPQFRENTQNFRTFVAQSFGKYLSQNQGVSILPYTKGSDIGNKMALRFSDARVFELLIPEPQYAVQLTVRGFKKVCTEDNTSGSCWVYGAYANIKVYQPTLGKVYMNENIKHVLSKVIPSTQLTSEDWPIYQNCLMALFHKVTQEFSTESKYKDVRKVIEKCY